MPSVDLHRASPVRQVLTEPVPLSLQTLLGLSLASSLPRSLSLSLSLILYCSLARSLVRSFSLTLARSLRSPSSCPSFSLTPPNTLVLHGRRPPLPRALVLSVLFVRPHPRGINCGRHDYRNGDPGPGGCLFHGRLTKAYRVVPTRQGEIKDRARNR